MEAVELSAPAPLPLAEVLTRYRAEAEPGVCDTGRYRCRYFAWGQGPPLVFVHGLSDRAESFAPMIAHLAAHFRCVAYDLAGGMGDGARIRRYRHADLAADLLALLDHLGLRETYLFASSFGSTVGLRAMAAQPGRVVRAVLQGGFPWHPLDRGQRWFCTLARYWRGRMADLPFRDRLQGLAEGPYFRAAPPGYWGYFLHNSGHTPIEAGARRGLMIDRLDLRQLLPGIAAPVLLIGGDRDPLVRPLHEQLLLTGLPNASRVELPDAGHLTQYTHCGLLAELTRRFLQPAGCDPSDCHDDCSTQGCMATGVSQCATPAVAAVG